MLSGPNPSIESCNRIITELEEGLKVQESSTNMMQYIVQDMLDYA